MKIYKTLNKYDLCYTKYKKREHAFWKRMVSSLIFSQVLSMITNIYLSSFKGFNGTFKKISSYKKYNLIDSLLIKEQKKYVHLI